MPSRRQADPLQMRPEIRRNPKAVRRICKLIACRPIFPRNPRLYRRQANHIDRRRHIKGATRRVAAARSTFPPHAGGHGTDETQIFIAARITFTKGNFFMRRHASGAQPLSLEAYAAEIYDECGRDSEKAAAELYSKTRHIAAYVNKGHMIGCRQLIGDIMGRDRRIAISGGNISLVVTPSPANDADCTISAVATSAVATDGATSAPRVTIPHEEMPSYQSAAALSASTQRLRTVLTGIYATPFKHDGRDIFLGTATREELQPVRDRYLATGRKHTEMGNWLERIIAAAEPGVPIMQCLSAKRLERLRKEVSA